MATRAAIASKDREVKKKIADEDRRMNKKIADDKLSFMKERGLYQNIKDAASSTKDLLSAAKGISALGNHPEWYKKFLQGYSAGNLPTFTRLGVLNDVRNFIGNTTTADTNRMLANAAHAPAILVFHYVPTLANPGADSDPRSQIPINTGLTKMMANLRALNSRVGEYDPADLGMYFYGAAEYMYVIEKLRQALKLCNTYLAENYYFCKGMLESLGWDSDFVFNNQAELKQLLRKHIAIFNSSVCIPKELSFFARRMWLAQAFMRDHEGNKSQYYAFVQDVVGVLSPDEDKIVYGASNENELAVTTVTQLANKLNTIKTNLVDSTGMIYIVSDLRAGLKDFYQLEEFKGDEQITATDAGYDLEQVHNLRTLPIDARTTSTPIVATLLDISQDEDGYLWQGQKIGTDYKRPRFTPSKNTANRPSGFTPLWPNQTGIDNMEKAELLNIYHYNVNEDDILEATRLRQLIAWSSTEGAFTSYVCGTEIVLYGRITVLAYGTSDTYLKIPFGTYVMDASGQLISCTGNSTTYCFQESSFMFALYGIYSRFDWIPVVRSFTGATFSGHVFGEFDNYFPISKDNLKMLHEACCLSLFYLDGKQISFRY